MTLVMLAAAILVPAIFYYLTLHQTMNAIEGGNRPFPGGLIWLAFVPFLGTIWYMVYVILRSSALKKAFARRQLPGDAAMGITVATVVLIALCMGPYLNLLSIIPAIVLWIIHCVKMANCKRVLAMCRA